jgi:hypothetical protein
MEAVRSSQIAKWVALGWAPIAIVFGSLVINVFRNLSPNKATGLGAIAGGLQEALVMSGLVALVGCELLAIYSLMRSYPEASPVQRVASGLTIVAGLALVAITALLFVWLRRVPH